MCLRRRQYQWIFDSSNKLRCLVCCPGRRRTDIHWHIWYTLSAWMSRSFVFVCQFCLLWKTAIVLPIIPRAKRPPRAKIPPAQSYCQEQRYCDTWKNYKWRHWVKRKGSRQRENMASTTEEATTCWTNLITTVIFAVVSTVLRLILILSMQLLYLYLGCYYR